MSKGVIRLAYRKIIDDTARASWDRYVFEDSYTEFLLQAQFYNQEKKYRSFDELVRHVKGADKLHFLVSSAVSGYLQQLEGKVPDITNCLGQLFLPFHNYRFDIIQSDIQDKSKHRIAITFFTEPMVWLDTIADRLLLLPDSTGQEPLTEMLTLQPYLSIYSIHYNHRQHG